MDWSAFPYYDCYDSDAPPLIKSDIKQHLYMGNDTIPKVFLSHGFDQFKLIKPYVNLYQRNPLLETLILEQICHTQESSNYRGCHYDYQCHVFSYQNLHLITVFNDEFCLNLAYNESQKEYIMSQSDGFSLDIQTPRFRYLYRSDFDVSSSSTDEEKTAKMIYDEVY